MAYAQPHTTTTALDYLLDARSGKSKYASNRFDPLASTDHAHKRNALTKRDSRDKNEPDAFAAQLQELCQDDPKPYSPKLYEQSNGTTSEEKMDDNKNTEDYAYKNDHSRDASTKSVQVNEGCDTKDDGDKDVQELLADHADGKKEMLSGESADAPHAQSLTGDNTAATKALPPDVETEETAETSLANLLLIAQTGATNPEAKPTEPGILPEITEPLQTAAAELELAPPPSMEEPPSQTDAAPALTTQPTMAPNHPPMDAQMLREKFDMLVMSAMKAATHQIRIQLEPVSLGRLTLECRETQQGLDLSINTQSTDIRNLLAEQEQGLRQSLEAQGLQLGQFSVACQDRQPQHQGGRASQTQDVAGEQEAEPQTNRQKKSQTITLGYARPGNHWVA